MISKNPLQNGNSHEENDSTAIPRRKASHAFITITDPKVWTISTSVTVNYDDAETAVSASEDK